MDNLENQPSQPSQPASTPAQPSLVEVQAQCASLASLLNSVLILIVVLAGAVDLFLVRQVKGTRADLNAARYYVAQLARNGQAIDAFAQKLAEYAKTHADYMPIAGKYGLKPTALTNTGATSGLPTPAPKKK
jgi:hypothetical protein